MEVLKQWETGERREKGLRFNDEDTCRIFFNNYYCNLIQVILFASELLRKMFIFNSILIIFLKYKK